MGGGGIARATALVFSLSADVENTHKNRAADNYHGQGKGEEHSLQKIPDRFRECVNDFSFHGFLSFLVCPLKTP